MAQAQDQKNKRIGGVDEWRTYQSLKMSVGNVKRMVVSATFLHQNPAQGTWGDDLKPCFGDYMGKTCGGHIGCVHEAECCRKHNVEHGYCDCKYKANCHIPRQYVASEAKKDIPDYKCSFYGYFEEDKVKGVSR